MVRRKLHFGKRTVEHGDHPKGGTINSRSMEHMRRLGVAPELRRIGRPLDHPTDSCYVILLAEFEIGRLPMPSTKEKMSNPGPLGETTAARYWPDDDVQLMGGDDERAVPPLLEQNLMSAVSAVPVAFLTGGSSSGAFRTSSISRACTYLVRGHKSRRRA